MDKNTPPNDTPTLEDLTGFEDNPTCELYEDRDDTPACGNHLSEG